MNCLKSFFSFDKFITPTIITILFWVTVVINGLVALSILATMIGQAGFFGFIMGVIVGAIYFVLTVAFSKVFYEIIMVIFKINDNLQAIRDQKQAD